MAARTMSSQSNLMVSGVSGRIKSGRPTGRMKNLDIVADEEFGTGIPPEYLETNSPNNRRVIEEAYDAYNLTKK